MNRSVAEFRRTVRGLPMNSSILIYFAGHGIQSRGENYLLPVDAQQPDDDRWKFHALGLSDLLEELCWREDQQKLIAIDACRTNGVAGSHRNSAVGLAGFAVRESSGVNETMILYAAAAGQVARDGALEGSSPFCRALLDVLERPARPLMMLAVGITRNVKSYTGQQQQPWKSDNLDEYAEIPFWPQRQSISAVDSSHLDAEPVPTAAVVTKRTFDSPHDAEIAQKGHLIHKLKAKDTTGSWAYYFVLVEPDKEKAFLQSIDGDGTVDLENYGSVIASCYGETPTVEICDYLREKYGFEISPEVAAPVTPKRALLVAMRRDFINGKSHWIVLSVATENVRQWAEAADELTALAREGTNAHLFANGIDGDRFDINQLARFGTILYQGYDSLPSSMLQKFENLTGKQFNWLRWNDLCIADDYYVLRN